MKTIFEQKKELLEKGDRSWIETDEEMFYEQLGCVPPERMDGKCFLVGEMVDYLPDGPLYSCFIDVEGRYFTRYVYLKEWNPARFRNEIIIQFML